ncbi:MAG: hypothetical protein ABSD27_06735 [Bryobacteraceae bacterium]
MRSHLLKLRSAGVRDVLSRHPAGRRPYDAEGLYYHGQALEGVGDAAGAREMYARAIEAARTAPSFRRRETARWSRLAQRQARKLG